MRCIAGCLVILLGVIAPAFAATPAGWRGDGTGVFADATPPLEFSAKPAKNIAWHVKVGVGYSSPVVVGDRVFVTSEPDKLICLNRADGKILWQKTNGWTDLPADLKTVDPNHKTACGYATPTPVADGKSIYVLYGTGIAASYDMEGKRNWIAWFDIEPTSPYGRSSSPLLVGEKLILPISRPLAVNPQDGKQIWRADSVDVGYGVPLVTTVGKMQVLVTASGAIVRMSDGKVLAKEIGTAEYSSPIAAGDMVYFIGTVRAAVRLTPKGEDGVTAKEIWNEDGEGEYFASPVLKGDHIYAVTKNAIFSAIDIKTGKATFSEPLAISPGGKPGEQQDNTFIYASPCLVAGGERLYFGNTRGDWIILKAEPKLTVLGKGNLGDGSPNTPVFAGKQMFVRGATELYCIEEK